MKIKLKKDITHPSMSFSAGTIRDEDEFSYLIGVNINEMTPEVKNEWFEPFIMDFSEEGRNTFRIKLHVEKDLREEVYQALYMITHKQKVNERTRTNQ